MALVQRDYILRLIEAAAAAIARALKRKTEGDLSGARQEIAESIGQVLGPRGSLATMVDARTAADLISDPVQIALYARLLDEDADILEQIGNAALDSSRKVRQRALELMLETHIRQLELRDEDNELTASLLRRVDHDLLSPRYHESLRDLDKPPA